MRHAYTPQSSAVEDFERSISPQETIRAQNLAPAIKDVLATVDYVFCSGALRARQTYELIKQYFRNNPEVQYLDNLHIRRYEYSQAVWDVLGDTPESKQNVLILGHNPGLTDFYNAFSIPSYDPIYFPNLCLAIIHLHQNYSWNEMGTSSAVEKRILT